MLDPLPFYPVVASPSHVFLTRFLSRISALLLDMDAARLLHWRSFASETVDERIEELRQKSVYLKRSKSIYEKIISLSVQDLHSQAGSSRTNKHILEFSRFCWILKCSLLIFSTLVQVSKSWWGRLRNYMTPAMELFFSTIVKPCLDIEPGAALKQTYLNQLLDYLASEEGTGQRDLDLVRDICSGKLQRHPALHGVPVLQDLLKVSHGFSSFCMET